MARMTAQQHIRAIESWVAEVEADQGISADECFSDVVHAYLDSQIGNDAKMRREILRGTGVGERRG